MNDQIQRTFWGAYGSAAAGAGILVGLFNVAVEAQATPAWLLAVPPLTLVGIGAYGLWRGRPEGPAAIDLPEAPDLNPHGLEGDEYEEWRSTITELGWEVPAYLVHREAVEALLADADALAGGPDLSPEDARDALCAVALDTHEHLSRLDNLTGRAFEPPREGAPSVEPYGITAGTLLAALTAYLLLSFLPAALAIIVAALGTAGLVRAVSWVKNPSR